MCIYIYICKYVCIYIYIHMYIYIYMYIYRHENANRATNCARSSVTMWCSEHRACFKVTKSPFVNIHIHVNMYVSERDKTLTCM